jgi:hypothetical protein
MTAAADRFTLSLLLSAASDLGARALTTSLREGCARFGRQGTHRQVTRQESFSSSFQQAFTFLARTLRIIAGRMRTLSTRPGP